MPSIPIGKWTFVPVLGRLWVIVGWGGLLLGATSLSGCATSYNPATERQEALFISTDREVAMGEAVARKVEEELEPSRDSELLMRLDRVGEQIAAVADRKELAYRFLLLEEKEPNAFALPGGIIYVTMGLMELIESDDELAAVLGHEVGHVEAKHSIKRIQGALGLSTLQVLAVGAGATDRKTQRGLDLAFASILTSYSQSDELEADRLSVRYLKRVGFSPDATIAVLRKIKERTQKQPLRRFSYFRTHPYFADRIRVVRQESQGQITFDDYINLSR